MKESNKENSDATEVSAEKIRETRWPSASRTRSRAPAPLRRRSITVAIMRTCSGHIRVDAEITQLISNLSPTNATGNTGVALPRIIATEAHAKDLSPGRSSNLDPISSDCGTPPPEQVPIPTPRESARERMARSKDRIAAANEK
mmetsp:Transcript_17750/g.32055  ORF Transcript_17750/g.32055 Transcript_17750/m.32055 type:complete len:144 (-) Transcript_17750:1183-1614(-)